jgi:TPR repeat protein
MPAPGQPRLSTEEIAALLARGDAAFAAGDVASARLFYQRAADAGDGQAAVRLGRTFDPGILSHARHHAVNGDPDRALAWYRRAAELGVSDTGVPLKTLKAN